MKNDSGITMTSLVIYVILFTVIIGTVSTFTAFFNKNVANLVSTVGESSEYNKFNLYILKYIKNGYKIIDSKNDESNCYITFSNGDDIVTFTLLENILYFNKIKLCENIDEFKWQEKIAPNGKNILDTLLTICGKTYTTSYVMY